MGTYRTDRRWHYTHKAWLKAVESSPETKTQDYLGTGNMSFLHVLVNKYMTIQNALQPMYGYGVWSME
jgi:hypothetical protein